MTKQDYIEMGFTEEDSEYLEEYPKLFPMVSTFGISKEKVDYLFSKMNESLWLETQTNHKSRQLRLHSIFARLNYFNKPYELHKYKGMKPEELLEVFGLRNVQFMHELLKVI